MKEKDLTLKGISVFSGKLLEITVSRGRIGRIIEIPEEGDFPFIAPGFLDIQVNGYAGIDYSSEELTGSGMKKVITRLAESGTTQHMPTIITSPRERIVKNLETMADMAEKYPEIGAAISGFHIEGPFISKGNGPRGAHDANYVRNPDFGEFEAWQNAARGKIKIVTLAPEKKGAIDFIKKITDTGVVAAIGHTDAPAELIHTASRAGARLSTHLGNGSHSLLPRLDNYIWEQLANDKLCASIVTDGFHLPSSVIKVFRRSKDPSRLILVSDVSPLGGLAPGKYRWGNIKVEIHEDGHLGLPGSSILAGSGHMLDWDIPRFMAATNCLLDEAVRLCTENPARLLSLPYTYGKLETGSPANLVLFRVKEGSPRLEVEQTIRNGKTVFTVDAMTGSAP